MKKIRWLDLAVDDLADIADYIVARDNPDAAKRIVSRLWSAVRSLATQLEMGRPGRVFGARELIVSGTPFIVPYRIIKSEIHILRVLHSARRWPDEF